MLTLGGASFLFGGRLCSLESCFQLKACIQKAHAMFCYTENAIRLNMWRRKRTKNNYWAKPGRIALQPIHVVGKATQKCVQLRMTRYWALSKRHGKFCTTVAAKRMSFEHVQALSGIRDAIRPSLAWPSILFTRLRTVCVQGSPIMKLRRPHV